MVGYCAAWCGLTCACRQVQAPLSIHCWHHKATVPDEAPGYPGGNTLRAGAGADSDELESARYII